MAKIPQVIKEIKIYVGKDEKEAQMMERDFSKNYLTFKALEQNCKFRLATSNISNDSQFSYSIDNGKTWTTKNVNTEVTVITSPLVLKGKTILWKGNFTRTSSITGGITFSSTGKYDVYGNVMSLLYNDDFKNKTEFPNNYPHNLYNLFNGSQNLVNAKNLILPVKILTESCYKQMFLQCTSLVTAPKLPATILAKECYMGMFQGCISLTSPPKLPAVTLSDGCYKVMFMECTSLTTAPKLPAQVLVNNCYFGMFNNCIKLNYIQAMFITEPSISTTFNWLENVATTGTFIKNFAASWTTRGSNGIPQDWTVETVSE